MQAVTKNDVIRIYWTRMEVANTLAYYDIAIIMAIKIYNIDTRRKWPNNIIKAYLIQK
jgi:hypothetical protein